ncbi:MAG: DUF5615 family PIN-like protein [Planctomycetaceae bacterium]
MRFLVDECTGPKTAKWLRDQGHEVFSVYDQARGLDDDAIFKKVLREHWILITNDKDFGEKVYREQYPHHGVVFLRLEDSRSENQIKVLGRLLGSHAEKLPGQFVVVTEGQVRFRRSASPEMPREIPDEQESG